MESELRGGARTVLQNEGLISIKQEYKASRNMKCQWNKDIATLIDGVFTR